MFYWVLLGFTGFYWVLLGFTGFCWVPWPVAVPHWLLPSLTRSERRFFAFEVRRFRLQRWLGYFGRENVLNFWYSQSSKRAYFYRFAVSTCRNRPLFFVHACSASLINFVFLFLVPKTSPASTILSFLVFSIDFHSFIFYRVVVFFVGFRSAEHLFGVSIGRDQFWFRPCPFFLIRLFHCFDFSCILPDFSLCNRFSKVIPSI